MGNPAEFSEKEFIAIKSLEVRAKLWPVIFKDIQVQRFILSEPHIVLVKNRQKQVNYVFMKGGDYTGGQLGS